jgi:hypothetical protein
MPEVDWLSLLTRRADGYRLTDPAEMTAIKNAQLELGVRLPVALRELYVASDGVFDAPGQWFVIWPLAELVRRNLEAYTAEGASRSQYVGFGDDGTGDPFCIRRDGSQGVFIWSPIDQSAVPVAEDIVTFWSGWTDGTLPIR